MRIQQASDPRLASQQNNPSIINLIMNIQMKIDDDDKNEEDEDEDGDEQI